MRWCSFGSAPMISSFVSTYLAQSRKPLFIYIILFQQMVRFRQDDESFFFRELPDPSIHMYHIIHARSCTVSFDFLCDFSLPICRRICSSISLSPFLLYRFFCIFLLLTFFFHFRFLCLLFLYRVSFSLLFLAAHFCSQFSLLILHFYSSVISGIRFIGSLITPSRSTPITPARLVLPFPIPAST